MTLKCGICVLKKIYSTNLSFFCIRLQNKKSNHGIPKIYKTIHRFDVWKWLKQTSTWKVVPSWRRSKREVLNSGKHTLWLFNIAMENGPLQMIFPLKPPFIMDFPVRYVSHNQRVRSKWASWCGFALVAQDQPRNCLSFWTRNWTSKGYIATGVPIDVLPVSSGSDKQLQQRQEIFFRDKDVIFFLPWCCRYSPKYIRIIDQVFQDLLDGSHTRWGRRGLPSGFSFSHTSAMAYDESSPFPDRRMADENPWFQASPLHHSRMAGKSLAFWQAIPIPRPTRWRRLETPRVTPGALHRCAMESTIRTKILAGAGMVCISTTAAWLYPWMIWMCE